MQNVHADGARGLVGHCLTHVDQLRYGFLRELLDADVPSSYIDRIAYLAGDRRLEVFECR